MTSRPLARREAPLTRLMLRAGRAADLARVASDTMADVQRDADHGPLRPRASINRRRMTAAAVTALAVLLASCASSSTSSTSSNTPEASLGSPASSGTPDWLGLAHTFIDAAKRLGVEPPLTAEEIAMTQSPA